MVSKIKQDSATVPQYYAGKSVFITGGTGFLGKALIEKLLYSCNDIGKIYMLIREKKGVSAQERIKRMLDTAPFARLREEKPKELEKIIPIYGDLGSECLGISKENQEILFEEVAVVFHLAATIKFNEPLSVAMKINVEGTQEVMKLAHKMKKIKSFVHMSTAFSNTGEKRTHVEEKMYPPPKPTEEVYDMIKNNDPKEKFSPKELDGRANTYTFTKALAEHYVVDNHGDLPTVIIRPSVITSAMKEPAVGWIDNWQGPAPILTLIAKGWLRTIFGHKSYAFEIIPIDYVVNLTIVSGAKCTKSKEVPIYHCCSSGNNPITLYETAQHYTAESLRQGCNELPYPGVIFSRSLLFLSIISFFLQTGPAYIADFFLYMIGKPARYVKVQNKLASYLDTVRFFTAQSWKIMLDRTVEFYHTLNSEDKKLFPFDATDINWAEYIPIYFRGVKEYLIDPSEKKKH